MILRDYQQAAIAGLRAEYRSGRRRVLLQLPTGAGKTVIFAAAVRMARDKGRAALVLVHRVELVRQAAAMLRGEGLRVGTIGASLGDEAVGDRDDARVALIQTCSRRKPVDAWEPRLIVVDEAHLSVAPSYLRVLTERHPRSHVLGVTATPERTDGKPLADVYDALVRGPPFGELQRAGHLVPIVTWSIPGADLSGARMTGGDFARADVADAMDRPRLVGDVVREYRGRADGRAGIVFASSVAHAANLCAAFVADGVRAATVTGKTAKAERRAILAALASGKLDVVTNYGVLIEGIDVPRISYIGLARATASLVVYLQAIGRGSRPHPGKTDCVVCDHGGNAVERFGLPEQSRSWSLEGRPRGPRGESAAVLAAARCSNCAQMWERSSPGERCPRCGGEAERRERNLVIVDGRLVRLTQEMIKAQERERSKTIPMRPCPSWADQHIWERCEAKRQRLGYKPGWTFGVVKRLMERRRA